MQRILQKRSNDCGVACVAMLINKYTECPAESAYDAAKAAMFGRHPATRTLKKDLRKGLKAFGIKSENKYVDFDYNSPSDMGLKFDAIIATRPIKKEDWHWLVWDADTKTLLDPNPNKKSNSHRSAYQYIKILTND